MVIERSERDREKERENERESYIWSPPEINCTSFSVSALPRPEHSEPAGSMPRHVGVSACACVCVYVFVRVCVASTRQSRVGGQQRTNCMWKSGKKERNNNEGREEKKSTT